MNDALYFILSLNFGTFDRSLLVMGALTIVGSGVGAYIMAMAVFSPCPLLVHDTWGGVIIVGISPSHTDFTVTRGIILGDEGTL